jgi:hypothetical protein
MVMRTMEIRSIFVMLLGIIIALVGMYGEFNYMTTSAFTTFLTLLGMWLVFAGWSSYALIGKGYKPGFSVALGFLALFGVIIAYILPSKKEYYSRNKYLYLEQIAKLRDSGELTDEEYEIEKLRIMGR